MGEPCFTVKAAVDIPIAHLEYRHYHWREPAALQITASDGYYIAKTMSAKHVRARLIKTDEDPCCAPAQFGRLSVHPANHLRQVETESGQMTSLICIIAPNAFERIAGLVHELCVGDLARLISMKNLYLNQTMDRLYRELNAPDFASNTMIEALCTSMIAEIGRYLRDARPSAMRSSARRRVDIAELKRFIENSAHDRVTIASLAVLCGISENHLMRTFKEATGETVHGFVAGVRLLNAERLLADTDLSMKQIAYELGFAGPNHFSTAFRNSRGETPSQYRARILARPRYAQ